MAKKLKSSLPTLADKVRKEMNTGTVATVKPRVRRVISEQLKEARPDFTDPAVRTKGRGNRGRKLSDEIRLVLKQKCKIVRKNGKYYTGTRFQQAAEAFVEEMEAGNFPFFKEFMERDEGKVATTVNLNDVPVKMYDAPTTGKNSP